MAGEPAAHGTLSLLYTLIWVQHEGGESLDPQLEPCAEPEGSP